MSDIKLPPLPEPYDATESDDGTVTEYFTGKDLNAYARAAIAPYKAEIELLRDDNAKWKAGVLNMPMKYKRMEFNAQLQRQVEKAEAKVERLKNTELGWQAAESARADRAAAVSQWRKAAQENAKLRELLAELLIAEKLDDDDPRLVAARHAATAALLEKK